MFVRIFEKIKEKEFSNSIGIENIDFIELKPLLDLARKHHLTLSITFLGEEVEQEGNND